MSNREYQGPPLDATGQHITEAPYWQTDGETVAVVDDAPAGEATTEDVPTPAEASGAGESDGSAASGTDAAVAGDDGADEATAASERATHGARPAVVRQTTIADWEGV